MSVSEAKKQKETEELVAIASSMWHRGRKTFVPWTAKEIHNRTGIKVTTQCRAVRLGVIEVGEKIRACDKESHTYNITEAGKALTIYQEALGETK